MGYCIEMLDSKFKIKKEDFDKALESLKSVFVKDRMTCQDSSGYHYSWINTNYVLEAETLSEALEEIRYETIYDDNGNIIQVEFTGEKLGDDMIFFEALAPYVEDESYISFAGEDGYLWKYIFEKGKVKEISI